MSIVVEFYRKKNNKAPLTISSILKKQVYLKVFKTLQIYL